MRLYTESILGPPVRHPDIDAILEKRVGNRELPGYLATIGNGYINRQMWRKAEAYSKSPNQAERFFTGNFYKSSQS